MGITTQHHDTQEGGQRQIRIMLYSIQTAVIKIKHQHVPDCTAIIVHTFKVCIRVLQQKSHCRIVTIASTSEQGGGNTNVRDLS
jgi:hypothetical protein